jgi:hypothetical protein
MGRSVSFDHGGKSVGIKIPPLERVGDQHNDDALAVRGAWNSKTGEAIYFHIRAVDVVTTCQPEIDLPDAVLQRQPNAYDLIDKGNQARLNAIAGEAADVASSAFEYWISLIRWVTGVHGVGRELRVGYTSGWSTYLHDCATDKPVWAGSATIVVHGVHSISDEEWRRVQAHAAARLEPPLHANLLADAKHCIDVGDYRRALVDLSVACEVYLRTAVLDALPPGVLAEAVRVIEEANINQFVSHLFPALLSEPARREYKQTVKDDLSSLFARRNKLMHMAAMDGADRETCERFRRALEILFSLTVRAKS